MRAKNTASGKLPPIGEHIADSEWLTPFRDEGPALSHRGRRFRFVARPASERAGRKRHIVSWAPGKLISLHQCAGAGAEIEFNAER
jgi:hypothetical protein